MTPAPFENWEKPLPKFEQKRKRIQNSNTVNTRDTDEARCGKQKKSFLGSNGLQCTCDAIYVCYTTQTSSLPAKSNVPDSRRGISAATTSNGAMSKSSIKTCNKRRLTHRWGGGRKKQTHLPCCTACVSAPGLQTNSPGTVVETYVPRSVLLSICSSR